MFEALFNADRWLFHAINNGWSNSVLDVFMVVVTTTAYWRPVYAVGIGFLLVRGFRIGVRNPEAQRYLWCAGLLLFAVALLDPLSHNLLKETISRPRPYLVLHGVHQLVASGGGSFPSNHALNNTAAAVIITWFFPRWQGAVWTIVFLVCVSRVYVGVHYPSDVIGGAVIGACAGTAIIGVWQHLLQRYRSAQPPQS